MKRVKIFGLILSLGFLALIVFTFLKRDKPKEQAYVQAELSDFVVDIETKGEVVAGSSVSIYMPDIFFTDKIGMYEIKITDIVPEGTFVKKGDYLATLDHSVVDKEIEEEQTNIDKLLEQLDVAKLDSTVRLSEQRNKITQAADNLEEKKLLLEQSKYESKAVQRKAQINVDQAFRLYQNTVNNYQRMQVYETKKIGYSEDQLKRSETIQGYYKELRANIKIKAPQAGLVIYSRDRRGNKIMAGYTLNRYSSSGNMIAQIPNLDSLISLTYINEIDITKVYTGQKVLISIDAVPDRTFQGEVSEVSKIGKKSNTNGAKVFMVEIHIKNPNGELKPSMSTTNRLELQSFTNVLTLPVNALYSEKNKHYVYLKTNFTIIRKEVKLGMQDDNMVIVLNGLNNGDKCLIKEPENLENIKTVPL